jgi:hypothetical protein
MARSPGSPLVPGDDVSEAMWMRVDDLAGLGGAAFGGDGS